MVFRDSIDIPEDCHPSYVHKFCYRFLKPYLGNGWVLDIGCWIGEHETYLRTNPVVGIDIELRALVAAKKFHGKKNFALASATDLPFRPDLFSTVTMWGVLEHVPASQELRVMKEVQRVCTLGAHLVLSVPYNHPLANFLDMGLYMVRHRHYSIRVLRELFAKSGFLVKTVDSRGGFLHSLNVLVFYVHKHIMHRPYPQREGLERILEKEYLRKGFYLAYAAGEKVSTSHKTA